MTARIRSSIVLLMGGAVLAVLLWSIGLPTTNSDGYYYLTVARNFVETGTFTYDTIHSTNGFHWAWMGLLIGISALMSSAGFQLNGPELVGVITVVSCAFYAGAARELARILMEAPRLADVRRFVPLLVCFVFLEPNLISLSISGLETSLFLFLLLRLVRLLGHEPGSGAPLIYIALTLTRIEGVVLAPFVVMYGHRRGSSRLYRAAMSLAPVLVIFSLNYVADGSLLSNSSQAKAFWAGLARERYFWDVPASASLVVIAKELTYLPGTLWQLLLSIRDDRVLGKISAVLLVTVMYGAFSKRSVIADRLHSRSIFLMAWYSLITWCAYKTIYFTPRNAEFAAQFAVSDYQSIWYFAPLSLLVALVLHLTLFSTGGTLLARLAPGTCLVVILWIRAVSSLPQNAGINDSSQCQPAPGHAVFVAQNDDGFAYRQRLPIVLLDGLVTGRRLSDGVSYLSAVREGSIEAYLADLSPGFIRVGTERLLFNLKVSAEHIAGIRAEPVVHLCGMGDWYDGRAGTPSEAP